MDNIEDDFMYLHVKNNQTNSSKLSDIAYFLHEIQPIFVSLDCFNSLLRLFHGVNGNCTQWRTHMYEHDSIHNMCAFIEIHFFRPHLHQTLFSMYHIPSWGVCRKLFRGIDFEMSGAGVQVYAPPLLTFQGGGLSSGLLFKAPLSHI